MPEGHTIHMFASDHNRAFGGGRIAVTSPQGRFTQAKSVDGQVLKNVRAIGKNLFYEFDEKKIIHVHLGLHGKFTLTERKKAEPIPEPRESVRMRMVNDRALLDLVGPIRCEVIDRAAKQKVIDRLGPDVLDPDADPQRAWKRISKTSTAIGMLLMDQTILSGIGNAYRCELLYRQRLHPKTPGKSLSEAAFKKLWLDAVHLLKMGIKHRQAWAVDEADVKNPPTIDGQPDRYNVYRREKCRGCGTKVKELPMGGRRCFYCPKEQKPLK